MDCLQSIFTCLPLTTHRDEDTTEMKAQKIVNALLLAEKPGQELKKELDGIVGTSGWKENIAKAVLGKLTAALQNNRTIANGMRDAEEKSFAEATRSFARQHPVFLTVVALGILVILAPYIVESLGFGELGPIEGSFAAAWQARYAGWVPKGTLFSFFQRLGMVWHR